MKWEIAQINSRNGHIFRGGYTAPGTRDAPVGPVRFPVDFDGANRRGLPEAHRTTAKHGDYARSQPTRLRPQGAIENCSAVEANPRTIRAHVTRSVAQIRGEAPRYITPHHIQHDHLATLTFTAWAQVDRQRADRPVDHIRTGSTRRLKSRTIRPHFRLNTNVTGLLGGGRPLVSATWADIAACCME